MYISCKQPDHGMRRHVTLKRGFSLVELLVVISIIVILIAILIPALAAAKADSETVVCLANQRTIAQSLIMFAHQHKGYMVKGSNNGYSSGSTVCDGSYYGSPQIWNYATTAGTPLNWDQVLMVDKYVSFKVLQDPADTSDDYLLTGSGQLRYSSLPTSIASAPIYDNLPGSYRLNISNQPEDAANSNGTPYTEPPANAYAMVTVPDPSQAIVLCDGGYDPNSYWQYDADVATWASTSAKITLLPTGGNITGEELNSVHNPNSASKSDIPGTYNVNTTIHSGKFNVAFLDGHCATTTWADSWATAGQPVVVGISVIANLQTTQWRQIFSPGYLDQ